MRGWSAAKPPVARVNQRKPRSGVTIARNRAIVMPLRGMARMVMIPGVPLRSTPGYPRLAAPRHKQ